VTLATALDETAAGSLIRQEVLLLANDLHGRKNRASDVGDGCLHLSDTVERHAKLVAIPDPRT
jgi:propanediol dehydratase small subunit